MVSEGKTKSPYKTFYQQSEASQQMHWANNGERRRIPRKEPTLLQKEKENMSQVELLKQYKIFHLLSLNKLFVGSQIDHTWQDWVKDTEDRGLQIKQLQTDAAELRDA